LNVSSLVGTALWWNPIDSAVLNSKVGRREIGYLHGNRLADLPFPVTVRKQLVEAGKESHHVLPESGWISYRIRGERSHSGHRAVSVEL
jgi:hypothetical protein